MIQFPNRIALELSHLCVLCALCGEKRTFKPVTVKQPIKVGALGPSAPSLTFRARTTLSAGRFTGARRTYLSDLAKHELNGYSNQPLAARTSWPRPLKARRPTRNRMGDTQDNLSIDPELLHMLQERQFPTPPAVGRFSPNSSSPSATANGLEIYCSVSRQAPLLIDIPVGVPIGFAPMQPLGVAVTKRKIATPEMRPR